MFSLIITIISIALVAALALATLYYGGSAFNRGSDGANAAQILNAAQQVDGALTLAKVDGHAVAAADNLSPDYLRSMPVLPGTVAWDAIASNDVATIGATGVPAGVCTELSAKLAGSCAAGVFTFTR